MLKDWNEYLQELFARVNAAYPLHIPVVLIGSQDSLFRCSDAPKAVAHIEFDDNVHEVFVALF